MHLPVLPVSQLGFGEHKSFPVVVGQLVGWERKKLLGSYAAVRNQTMMFRFYSTEFSTHNAQFLIHGQTLSIMLRSTTLSEDIFSGSTNKAGLTQESVMTSVIGHKVGDRVDLRGGWKNNKILTNLLNSQSFTLYYEQLYYIPNHQVMLAICCQKFSVLHIYQWCFPLFLCAVFQKHALLPYLINHLSWYNSLIYLLWNQPFSLPLPCSLSSRKLILSLEWSYFFLCVETVKGQF